MTTPQHITVPTRLFETPAFSCTVQHVGMWLCYLCRLLDTPEQECYVTLDELSGCVGEQVKRADIERLRRFGLIEAEEGDNGLWRICLLA